MAVYDQWTVITHNQKKRTAVIFQQNFINCSFAKRTMNKNLLLTQNNKLRSPLYSILQTVLDDMNFWNNSGQITKAQCFSPNIKSCIKIHDSHIYPKENFSIKP